MSFQKIPLYILTLIVETGCLDVHALFNFARTSRHNFGLLPRKIRALVVSEGDAALKRILDVPLEDERISVTIWSHRGFRTRVKKTSSDSTHLRVDTNPLVAKYMLAHLRHLESALKHKSDGYNGFIYLRLEKVR